MKERPRTGFTGWWIKARDEGLPLLSLGQHVTYIYVDVPKRRSRCRICKGFIVVGDRRGVLVAKYGYNKNFQGGGSSIAEQFFFHPDCMTGFLDHDLGVIPTFDAKAFCFDCERPFDGEFDFERRVWFNHSDFYLCQSCWDSARWRKCDLCERMLRRSATSPVVAYPGYWSPRDELAPQQFACGACVESDGVTTIRQRNAKERADDALFERFHRLAAAAERGDLFDGT